MASRKLREPRFWVYQLGRGSEPVIVVGSTVSLVARSMIGISPEAYLSLAVVYVCRAPLGNDSSIRRTTHGQKSQRCPLKLGSFHAAPKCLLSFLNEQRPRQLHYPAQPERSAAHPARRGRRSNRLENRDVGHGRTGADDLPQ